MASKSQWDLPWKGRPAEEAINLNPAFCGELIYRTVGEYGKALKKPIELPLSFLVLPIVLHKQTRDELPGKADTAFVGWVAGHGSLLARLPVGCGRCAIAGHLSLPGRRFLRVSLLSLRFACSRTRLRRLKRMSLAVKRRAPPRVEGASRRFVGPLSLER